MAVTKLWPINSRLGHVIDYIEDPNKTLKSNSQYNESDYQALKDVIGYVKNGDKTEQEYFCVGINCNSTTARDQFITVKQHYGKCDGIQAYHGYMSFKEQNITPELAQKIGMEFAQRMWGDRFQVVVTTHLNTEHLHCHFVVNSVSFKDGKRLHGDEKAWFIFHKIADEICKKYELSTIDNPQRYPDSDFMTKKDQAGMPTRYNTARKLIDEAISRSTNYNAFKAELKKTGCQFNLSENRKYWTVTLKGESKPIRLFRLGDDYTNERILERIEENKKSLDFKTFQSAKYKREKPQYVIMTRTDRMKMHSGLYGQYLHYCYRLGCFNRYKKQNIAKVHYLLRDDLMKIDELTAQTTLLGKTHIDTSEQLFVYSQKVEDEIKSLTSDRTHYRNKIRRVNITDEELAEDKEKISQITQKLKELRREKKLCEGIKERSQEISERLDEITKEEEKNQGKEKQSHGCWR